MKYMVTLYQIVKDTETTMRKIQAGADIRTYHNQEQYRAFHIDAFARDESGRKFIGKYYNRFSQKEFTLRDIQVHLFCKKIADLGSFTSEDIEFDTLFPKRQGSDLLHGLVKHIWDNERVILTENWELSEFRHNNTLRKAVVCRKFHADKDLPEDAFIVIDIEELQFPW